jgi:cbb3-type cytochrome oxidase subunit 3
MDYNENGIYFDGLVTYDIAAFEAFSLFTFILFLITTTLIFFRKKPQGNKIK